MMHVKDLGAIIDKPPTKKRKLDYRVYHKLDKKVSAHFNISLEDIYGDSRRVIHSEPRHIIWFILNKEYGVNKHEIGRRYKRAWATVRSGIEKVAHYKEYYNGYSETLNELI
jgi:chromosomal replication initiation ATPase DnaA